MKTTKENRKVKYTKKVIREAFIELLDQKELHQISVTDICKLADINRGTFYAHYKDAYDLLEKLEDEIFNQVKIYIDAMTLEQMNDELLPKILILIQENQDLARVIFLNIKDNRIIEKALELVAQSKLKDLKVEGKVISQIELDYYMNYIVGGMFAIIQTWLKRDFKESPQQILQYLKDINNLEIA